MVNIVVVVSCIHHLLQVVVVRYRELYGIRVGLTEVSLRIIGNIVVVLIPVYRRRVIIERLTISMQGSIIGIGEHLPSRAGDLESTRLNRRNLQTDGCTRQHGIWFLEHTNLWHTTLEIDVQVDNVTLTDRRDVITALITLLILIEVDDGDYLFFLQVIDVRLTGNIERSGLLRCCTVDDKACLLVDQLVKCLCINQHVRIYSVSHHIGFLGSRNT